MLYEVPDETKKDLHEGLIWSREEPGTRKPAYSRDKIAEAALKVADEEGLAALSMRRIAKELGAGTMTLYYYVRNKEELITLLSNRMMEEVLVPDDELSPDWREAMTQIARNTRNVFRRHPWALNHTEGGHAGPNMMRHFEQSLKAVESTGASASDRLDIVGLVDDYVFGYVMGENRGPADSSGDLWPEEEIDFFDAQIATGEYPQIKELFGDGTRSEKVKRLTEAASSPERFEKGLRIVLDGIEASLEPPSGSGLDEVR